MEGYILFRDGTLIRGYALGQPGFRLGRLVRFSGGIDPHFIATDPQLRDMIIVTDSPELGSIGARPAIDQSDTVQAASILCRDMVDFPSYRTNYRNIYNLFSSDGRFFISSLDMAHMLKRADDGEDVAIMARTGKAADASALEAMAERLLYFSHDGLWDAPTVHKRTVEFKNAVADIDIIVLDLGIRSGFLRALRSRSDVTLVPPDPSALEGMERRFDAVIISSGPGSLPSEELLGIVRTFYSRTGNVPVFAMGIGALALNNVLGGTPNILKEPHRSMSKNALIGGAAIPTYQSHEFHPGRLSGFDGSCFDHDGWAEVLKGCDRSGRHIVLSMIDTLPEYGMVEGDPLMEFLEYVEEGSG